ncbi:hypothetical protein ACLIKD_15675 [Azonexus sp. IMCC34842]|uniref:hypothetical protein n=1 Tax=Azonexus sp. IMCC34842 TaxID=3420950 RepID=UPI003D09E9E9
MTEQFTPHCAECHYFRPADASNGACHRFPPVFTGESSSRETHHWRFPAVNIHAWCGEFLPARPDQVASAGATI